MKNNIPIVFIHFGQKEYLKHTFEHAVRNNPNKSVYLLGDNTNILFKSLGIIHHLFTNYDQNEEIVYFNKNFKYIRGGVEHTEFSGEMIRIREFERFCFIRWFYLYFFLKENGFSKCWYFDSDTILLDNLEFHENKYVNFDHTVQSNGTCMKGLINIESLKKFIDTTNILMTDDVYLKWIKGELKDHSGWAFCDMRAYEEYARRFQPKTIGLFEVQNNVVFDDALLQQRDCEMRFNLLLGVEMKKLYFKDKNVFIRHDLTKDYIKLVCINLSWLPDFYIKYLLKKITFNVRPYYLFRYFFFIVLYWAKKLYFSLLK